MDKNSVSRYHVKIVVIRAPRLVLTPLGIEAVDLSALAAEYREIPSWRFFY